MNFSRHALVLVLCFIATMLYTQSIDLVKLSSKPGVYSDNVLLSAEVTLGYSLRYRFANVTDAKERFLSFNQPLVLGALPGETRKYHLIIQILKNDQEFERRDLEYTIDRCPPLEPEPLTAPFTYFAPTQVQLSLNSRDTDAKIRASYRGSDGSSGDLTDGSMVVLPGKTGQSITYTLSAYAQDIARNVSRVKNWTYTIDRRQERDLKEIPVYSPVEGRFQNPQYLYIDSQSFERIRYSLDGSDPRTGRDYIGGTTLDASGRVQLRIWGKTLLGRELEQKIVFEAGTERLKELENGIIGKPMSLQFTTGSFHYTAGERQPTSYDEVLSKPLRIAPQTGVLRGLPLRLLRDSDQAIFRYYLILDGRNPPMPELWVRTRNPLGNSLVSISSGSAVNDFLDVTVQASFGSTCWYRLDGSAPENSENQALPLKQNVRIDIADLRKYADSKGVCTIVFQSRQIDGSWGGQRRFLVAVHPTLGPPAVSIVPGADKIPFITLPKWEGTVWYMVNSEYHPTEISGPFELTAGAALELPFGAQGHFTYQFFGIDHDGMVTTSLAPIKTVLSALPPEEPVIVPESNGKIRIGGSGSLVYRISSDQKDAPSITNGFLPVTEPFELKPLKGANVVYWVEAQARDVSGNQSAIARAGPFPVHTRPPLAVRLIGGDSEIFRNTATFSLQIESPELGMQYHYTIGPVGTISDPDQKSPWVDSEIQVVRKEEKIRLEVRVVGISAFDSRLVGPQSRFIVNLDTRQPSLPKITGVESGHVYRTALSIEISSDPGSQISYQLRRTSDPTDNPYLDYNQVIRIDAPSNSAIDWILMVKTRNRAGSESTLPMPITFRIDTRIPPLSLISFVGSDGKKLSVDDQYRLVTKDDVSVLITSNEGISVRYELSQDPTHIRNPDQQSALYTGAITLSTTTGTNKAWFFRYRSFDMAGNESPFSGIYNISVNKMQPATPPPPGLIRQGNVGELFWTNDPSLSIQYFISTTESPDGQLAFMNFSGDRVHWVIPDGQDKLWLYYRALDNAGNSSETGSLTIERKQVAPAPQLSGVVNDGLYREPLTIRANNLVKGAVVRYELGTGDQIPSGVSGQSPDIGQALEIGPINGETVSYHLVVRQFIDGYEASDPLQINFIIDRTPPPPPKSPDFNTVNWVGKATSFHITGDKGDTVWYSIWSEKIDFSEVQEAFPEAKIQEIIANNHYQVLTDDISLLADPSAVLHYIVSAYSVDPAGNRSLAIANWQVFVDTQSVYVAEMPASVNLTDRGLETGSRTEPFRDITHALEFAAKYSRHTLVMSVGKFVVPTMIRPNQDVVIRGGFDPVTWTPVANSSTILYPRPSFSDKSLIDLRDVKLQLQGIYLIDADLQLDSLILQRKGELTLNECTLAVSQSKNAVDASQGTLVLNNAALSCNDSPNVTLLKLRAMDCHINGSTLESSDLPPVLLKNTARAIQTLVDAETSTIQASQSRFIPRRAFSTTAIRLRGGSFAFSRSELWTGGGTDTAIALSASQGAKVDLDSSSINGDPLARIAVLLREENSTVTIRGGVLRLNSESGVYGIMASSGKILLENAEIRAGLSHDFITAFSMDQAQLNVSGVSIYGAQTPDFRVAVVRGGTSSWKTNITKIDAAQTLPGSGLFSFIDAGQNEFENNNFAGNDRCTLFYLSSPDAKLQVKNNILEGWRFLLQETPTNLIRQSDLERGVSTIQELERLDRQGSLFEGNKVRQGL